MNMILSEGRKEDVYKKFQKSIDAERKMISTYMDEASAYDFLLDEPFIQETNYKYLNDILESYYNLNQYSGEAEPLEKEKARELLFSMRRQIDEYALSLETFETYKSKFKYPEFRQYLKNDINDFIAEAKKIRDEAIAKQNEKSAKKEVDKLFENDNLLIVKPKSYVASCYYGSGTRWCTTMKGQPSYFNQYSSSGNLYYLILKNVDRSNKFYKMAIHVPKNRNFESDSIWYDSTDERLTSREKESILAHMSKDAYNSMVNDYKKSFPEDKPLDVLYKLVPRLQRIVSLFEKRHKYKGGFLDFSISKPTIEDADNEFIRLSSLWEINEVKNNNVIYTEDGSLDFRFEAYNVQVVRGKYIIKMVADVIPYNTDLNIVRNSRFEKVLMLDEDKKSDPEHILVKLRSLLNEVYSEFYSKIMSFISNDETLSDRYKPTKAPAYTMANYTFTGKGKLTKAFMEYLKNMPEGKTGNKDEFLTLLGRRTGPGQYSSFFSALNQAGISARQGKSGLVKGPNFDKFYNKIFE